VCPAQFVKAAVGKVLNEINGTVELKLSVLIVREGSLINTKTIDTRFDCQICEQISAVTVSVRSGIRIEDGNALALDEVVGDIDRHFFRRPSGSFATPLYGPSDFFPSMMRPVVVSRL
jgi:hypothetical protein